MSLHANEGFQSETAKKALAKYESDIKDAEKKYIASLERAMGEATRGSKLEEAQRIKNEIERVTASQKKLAQLLPGTTWRLKGAAATATFAKNGKANFWGTQNCDWQVTELNTVVVMSPDRRSVWTLTFDPTFRFALDVAVGQNTTETAVLEKL